MEAKEIMKYVDNCATTYFRAIGDADHMEILDNGIYEMMRSRSDFNNLCTVYNIRIDHLPDSEMSKVIQVIKDLNVHTWWPSSSERLQTALNDWKKASYDDGLYGAMTAEDIPEYPAIPESIEVKRVCSLEDFEKWCEIDNKVEHSGKTVFHPQNHYHLIEEGKMRCYIGFLDGVATTTTALLDNDGIAILAFTTTIPEYRQRGIAKAACQVALADAFKDGMKVVCVGARENARILGKSLGFMYIDPKCVWDTCPAAG